MPDKEQEVTESVIESYDANRQLLICRYVIDAETYRKRFGGTPNDATLHEQLRVKGENATVRSLRNEVYAEFDRDLQDGVRDWVSLPETTQAERDAKQRYAQGAMRKANTLAREGKELNNKGQNRPEASSKFMETRSYNREIWIGVQNMFGTHAERAGYLALEGPGPGTEYGEMKDYFDDLTAHSTEWQAIVDYMNTAPKPKLIESEMTV